MRVATSEKTEKLHASTVPRGAQRVPMSRPDLHGCRRALRRFGCLGHCYAADSARLIVPNLGISLPPLALGATTLERAVCKRSSDSLF